jgi:hypothetical protein
VKSQYNLAYSLEEAPTFGQGSSREKANLSSNFPLLAVRYEFEFG